MRCEGAARRLRDGLAAPGLPHAVAASFDSAEGFAAMTYTCLGINPPDHVTADDLLAVSLLDIDWRPGAVRQLLETDAQKISGMLAAISTGIDLWDASDADLAAVDPLWDALLDMPGVGTATGTKLLARKRPRLCPVTDRVVIRAAGVPGRTWDALRCLLQDAGTRAEIESCAHRKRPGPACCASSTWRSGYVTATPGRRSGHAEGAWSRSPNSPAAGCRPGAGRPSFHVLHEDATRTVSLGSSAGISPNRLERR